MTCSAVSGAAERVSVNGCVTEIKAINERSTKNKNKIKSVIMTIIAASSFLQAEAAFSTVVTLGSDRNRGHDETRRAGRRKFNRSSANSSRHPAQASPAAGRHPTQTGRDGSTDRAARERHGDGEIAAEARSRWWSYGRKFRYRRRRRRR